MADEKKKVSAEASEKKEKSAKKSAATTEKKNIFARIGGAIKKFFKDVKGECKKVVWPDAKTVIKNTGIVLACVAVLGVIIYLIDQGLSWCIKELVQLAKNSNSAAATSGFITGISGLLGI